MSFAWNKSFETGIDFVDQRHHELIELINAAAPLIGADDSTSAERSEQLLHYLVDYAATLFGAEEELIVQRGLDRRHLEQHAAEHARFSEQVDAFLKAMETEGGRGLGAQLLGFLFNWLGVHILDLDQRMALQLAKVGEGLAPAEAYRLAQDLPQPEVSRQVLVAALVDLYGGLDERSAVAERARFQSGFDQMTGLPNRNHFLAELRRQGDLAGPQGQAIALLLLDVDDLSTINQNCGHAVADQLLREIADRLRAISRKQDLLARIGDDEFALLLVGGDDASALRDAAERLYRQVAAPLALKDAGIAFSLSAGVAVLPEDAVDGLQLHAAAEIALGFAKRAGGGRCQRFSAGLGKPGSSRPEAIQALRQAILHDELVLHYQPQLSLHSGEIVGLEALVRWQHPTRGMVPPGQFIPLAEETGLIVPLGEWVIRNALKQLGKWIDASLPVVRVAVNLSARHFRQAGLPDLLRELLAEHEISPQLLELELTESVMMHDAPAAIRIADQLKGLGLRLSLDDFGTGYSSLAYLSRFAIDIVKIDQSFVRDITSNPINASIAVATIAMAHKLGKSVIAEGVETEGQMKYLRRHDCDEMQGYYFAKPLPADEVAELLKSGAKLGFNAENAEDLPCLLLVDDELNILNALKRLLRREGYRILTAGSGAQGLELLAANRVQVILSDQRMPEMSGSEFLSRVKELYPDTVRMVLSGYAELASVTDAVNRGAIYKYLSKPWNEEELKAELRQAFRHQRELSA